MIPTTTRPACADKWLLFDSIDLTDHREAAAICRTCPLDEFTACRALVQRLKNRGEPQGTWAGQLWGKAGVRTSLSEMRRETEESMFSDDDARAAHAAYERGDRSDRAVLGERVYQRLHKRKVRAA